ncbi:MAG TPA: HlyD family secretion protein [Stellaceae bacterium]|nr:HlyD family secretion protein [Stellaceae bacterium]
MTPGSAPGRHHGPARSLGGDTPDHNSPGHNSPGHNSPGHNSREGAGSGGDAGRDLLLLPDDKAKQQPAEKQQDRPDESRPPPDPAEDARRKRRWRIIAVVAGLVLLIALIAFGWYWWTVLRWLQSTDDAYTQSDATIISPKIAGYIAKLQVTDNQHVNAGDVLLQIDPRDYQAALDQAQADVASAEADIKAFEAQTTMQQSAIEQARADVASAQAATVFARQEYARYEALARTTAGTVQRAQQARSDLVARQATLNHNQAALTAATDDLAVLKAQLAKAQATLLHNRAVLEQARLNLGYTRITSAVAGAVGDRSAREGLYVQPGQGLMTIVPLQNAIYVVANFKETQLESMFRGETVDMTIDTFGGAHFTGIVDSLAPGSGAQFALLPPENATGNFTKIVQRVPVKILIDHPPQNLLDQLRPGLSVVATVDLRSEPPPDKRHTLAAPAG